MIGFWPLFGTGSSGAEQTQQCSFISVKKYKPEVIESLFNDMASEVESDENPALSNVDYFAESISETNIRKTANHSIPLALRTIAFTGQYDKLQKIYV